MARSRTSRHLHAALWLGLTAVGLSASILRAQGDGSGSSAPTPPTTPFDQPLAWLEEARKVNAAIRDYTCTLVKQERVRNKLQAENIIQMKFRAQPFSVYMRWLAPREFRNQEVAFVYGRNRNKMRVHSSGLLKGAIGWVSIDPSDRRVMEHSRHTIYEAGIGNLVERTHQCWLRERQAGKSQVRVAEYDFAGRRCLRIETIRPDRNNESYCYRNVLYLDKESKLPVRSESYDWPRAGGPADGELLEVFSYIDLRFNLGLGDEHFNR